MNPNPITISPAATHKVTDVLSYHFFRFLGLGPSRSAPQWGHFVAPRLSPFLFSLDFLKPIFYPVRQFSVARRLRFDTNFAPTGYRYFASEASSLGRIVTAAKSHSEIRRGFSCFFRSLLYIGFFHMKYPLIFYRVARRPKGVRFGRFFRLSRSV